MQMPPSTNRKYSFLPTRSVRGVKRFLGFLSLAAFTLNGAPAGSAQGTQQLDNDPQRLEWFRDQGLGLFIHWSVDSQLGLVVSHTLAGASDEYVDRFYKDLPQTFNPTRFDPDSLARLARVAGFRYMVFTTKHHNGFCMWPTATEPFNIGVTPYRADITAQLFNAFRAQGIPAGVYFSPDDFHWLHENGKQIQRLVPGVQPSNNPGLLQLDRAQMTELMTKYGPVSVVFFDGEAHQLRDIVWKLQPKAIVTRGAIETPEQNVPGAPLPGAWESNMTVGTAWGYQPSDEQYKSPGQLIRTLIQTRARGGNLLLNVGLQADGSLPPEQEAAIRTMGSWLFINSDAIYGVRPWVITNEGNVWFTRSATDHSLYAIVDNAEEHAWSRGTARDFVLKTVRATSSSHIDVLGQNDALVEYRPELHPQSTLHQEADGLHLHVMRAQRLRDSDHWPYPTVIHITAVEEAFTPPAVTTLPATVEGKRVVLHGSWAGSAEAAGAQFSFDYRIVTGEDTRARMHDWAHLPTIAAERPGTYTTIFVPGPGEQYEVRAVLKHPLLTIYGQPVVVPQPE